MGYYDYRSYLQSIISILENIYSFLTGSGIKEEYFNEVTSSFSNVLQDLTSIISSTDVILKLLKWILILLLVKLFSSFCRSR